MPSAYTRRMRWSGCGLGRMPRMSERRAATWTPISTPLQGRQSQPCTRAYGDGRIIPGPVPPNTSCKRGVMPKGRCSGGGKTPPPGQKPEMGDSPLLSGRWSVDMLGRQGGTGEVRRTPAHPLYKGHREAFPLEPGPTPLVDRAQEATREKGNLRDTTADAAPATGIPLGSGSPPIPCGSGRKNLYEVKCNEKTSAHSLRAFRQ